MHKVIFEKVSEYGQLPEKAHDSDTGYDLVAAESKRIRVGDWETIRLGWKVRLPEGVGFQIRPRSGLAVKHGVTILNSPGTIDSAYVDEVKVILINHSKRDFVVRVGSRIAQLVFENTNAAFPKGVTFEEGIVGESERKGGLGHTGDTAFLNKTEQLEIPFE
jgi:dUTP pyrophosphatase